MALTDALSPAQKHTLAEAIRRMEADGLDPAQIKRVASKWVKEQDSSFRSSSLGVKAAQEMGLPPQGQPASSRRPVTAIRGPQHWQPKPVPPPPIQPRTLVEMAEYPAKLKAWQEQKAKIDKQNLDVLARSFPATSVPVGEGSPFREDPAIAQTARDVASKARAGFDPWKAVQEKILPGLQQGVGSIVSPGTRAIQDPEVRRSVQRGMGALVGAPGSVEELLLNAGLAAGVPLVGKGVSVLKAALKKGDAAFDAAVGRMKLAPEQAAKFKSEVQARFTPKELPGYHSPEATPIKGMAQTETRYVRDNWRKIVQQDIAEMERMLKGGVSQNHRRKITKALAAAKNALAKGEAPQPVVKQLKERFRSLNAPKTPEAPQKLVETPKTTVPTIGAKDAKEVRSNTGQVQGTGRSGQGLQSQSREDIQRPAQAGTEAGQPKLEVELPIGSAAKHEVTDAERELFGLKDRKPTERKADEITIGNAKKGYDGEQAQRLAKWGDRAQPLNDEQTVKLVYRKIELRNRHEALKEQIRSTPSKELYDELDEIERQFDQVATTLDRSGTETGRSLRIRQIELREDLSELEVKRRAKALGANEQELKRYEKLTSPTEAGSLPSVEKEIREAEKTLERAKAEGTLKKNRGAIFDKKTLDEEWEALRKQKTEITARLGANIDPELLIVLGKMAVNVAKRGINSIDELVRAIKHEFPGATDEEIIDAFNKESATSRTKAEISEELKAARSRYAALKREGKYDERLRKDIADYENQLRTGSYRLPTKEEKQLSDRLLLLKSHRENLRSEIKFRLSQQGKPRSRKVAEELTAFPKAAMSIADMSAVLRQGLLLAAGNPGKAVVALGRATRAMASPKFAAEFEGRLRTGSMAAARERAGLYLADQGVAIGKREEAFLSHLAEKIPVYGQVVKASERHFNTFLNSLRADAFDATYLAVGNMTAQESRALARFINVATGRGELGKLTQAADVLQHVFYSPRLVASRIQAPLDALGLTGRGREVWRSRGARRQMVQSWTSLVTSGMLTLKYLEANGAKVTWDPASSDFGKAVFGNTRIDIWGGFQQPVRQIASAIKKSIQASQGELKGQELVSQVGKDVFQFLRYKAAPGPTLAGELLTKKTPVGQDITRPQAALDAVTPLLVQDFIEALNDPKTPRERAVAGLAASFFGIGVSTYEKSEPKRK